MRSNPGATPLLISKLHLEPLITMTSRDDICSEIDTAFSEFVDEVEDVRNKLLELSKEHSYQIRKTREAFNAYLEGEGASGDMLKNMVETGIKMLKEQITPNKAVLFPRAAAAGAAGAKKSGLTAKKSAASTPASTDDAEPAESGSASSSPAKGKGKTAKAKDGPKRVYGFNLYQASIKDELVEKFPDNPTARSKEAGQRWKDFQKSNPKEAEEFNEEARRLTEESGYEAPASKKKVKDPSEKRPIQPRQAFHSDQYEKYAEIFRKKPFRVLEDKTLDYDNPDWKEGDSVPPKYVMRLTADAWNKLTAKQQEKYQKMADEQNEREGRHHKEKGKKEGDELKPTSGYRLFQADFREQHENEYESYFAMADVMNKEWATIKKAKGDAWEEWQEKAKAENDRRSKLREQAEAEGETVDATS